jgi:hypothetical protein
MKPGRRPAALFQDRDRLHLVKIQALIDEGYTDRRAEFFVAAAPFVRRILRLTAEEIAEINRKRNHYSIVTSGGAERKIKRVGEVVLHVKSDTPLKRRVDTLDNKLRRYRRDPIARDWLRIVAHGINTAEASGRRMSPAELTAFTEEIERHVKSVPRPN